MTSLLKSTQNTRSILPNSLRYIRSDVPNKITHDEVQWLLNNNIFTIIDLREEAEKEQKKCPLEQNKAFHYLNMPVTGGNAVPQSPNDVSKTYLKMVDIQMRKIISIIEGCNNNVLFFCNAGKDRTGVVAALLLQRLGMDREYIINDYLISAENLKNSLYAYSLQNKDINIEVITPRRRYMEEFLENCATIMQNLFS